MTNNEIIQEWQNAVLTDDENNYFWFEMNGEMFKAWPSSLEVINGDTFSGDKTITLECKFTYDGIGS